MESQAHTYWQLAENLYISLMCICLFNYWNIYIETNQKALKRSKMVCQHVLPYSTFIQIHNRMSLSTISLFGPSSGVLINSSLNLNIYLKYPSVMLWQTTILNVSNLHMLKIVFYIIICVFSLNYYLTRNKLPKVNLFRACISTRHCSWHLKHKYLNVVSWWSCISDISQQVVC